MLGDLFREFSTRKLKQMAGRIDACLDRLDEGQIWTRAGDHENAIGNLVLHLTGNLGQWILSGVGSAPDTRCRDDEFNATHGLERAALKAMLAARVAEAAACIGTVSDERLTERTRIQTYDVTVLEAIYHVVEHFSLHAGQIFYLTKLLTGNELGFSTHNRIATAAASEGNRER